MEKAININDVAKKANVSIATVSNVINGKGRVSEKTIKKVNEVIEQLKYYPNLTARNLKTNRSFLIGIVVPMEPGHLQDNPFYWDLLSGVELGAKGSNFHFILAGINEQTEDFTFVRKRQLDGLIVVGTNENSRAMQRILELGIPCCFVDCYLSNPALSEVYTDDYFGGYLATNCLVKEGHKRIALLIGDIDLKKIDYFGVLHQRWLGYKQALQEANIVYDPDLMITFSTSMEGGYQASEQLINQKDVTAIFSLSDISAMGLLKGLADKGKKVPDDYSVIGFDDVFMSKYMSPSLTTVSQNILEKGRVAIKLLLDQIEGEESESRKVVLPVELLERDTIAKPRK